ncbi:E3 ubiquitin-protein ligase UHRF1 [Frankliniella fusca]|uniref:E3 ubiquitin-protein ligase UHRF1 n=1 Tax=Frankliniella fusca TaxID=407009 RepID=A0AAE1HVT8_9NEOP|nr:E3 ubiquitin-protein ligase UHRF1 [Frankliniella fusca]
MANLSAYQQLRKANLNENTELLMQYGLQAPVVETSSVRIVDDNEKKKRAPKPLKPKKSKDKFQFVERRTSFRVRLKVQQESFDDYESLKDSDEDGEDEAELMKNLSLPNRNVVRPPQPNTYGPIEGVKVGTWWETRLDCNYDGIHRPTVAGIHQGPNGAYSVALSGGYEDDVDLGDSFTYTGEGGRDLKGTATNPKNLRTAPQSKDQQLVRGNLALSRNVETGNPVRVIRGYKLNSKFAPERGYRYDGLYKITKYWETYGKSGFKVYKFSFLRCDPEPAPWDKKKTSPVKTSSESTPENNEKYSFLSEDPEWHGWPDACVLPKLNCLSIKCGDDEEKLCLSGDTWIPVTNMPQKNNTCTASGAVDKNDSMTSDSSPQIVDKIDCYSQYELSEYDSCKFGNTCDWLGWGDSGLSIFDIPSTFNCALCDNC